MEDKKIKNVVMIVGVVFLVSLTVLTNVIIGNEVKRANFIGLNNSHLRTINVMGEGKTYAIPDTASISFSVITIDEKSEVALNENNKKSDAVVNYLKEQGIEKENIQTVGLNVQPIYERDPDSWTEMQIIHYQVTNRIEVKFKDLDKVNTVIDGAIRVGANKVDSFLFLISDEEELKTETREKAIQEARKKAKETTAALGVKLGRVISFSESRDYYTFPVMQKEMMAMDQEGTIPEMPIEPGENEIIITVTIEYEII